MNIWCILFGEHNYEREYTKEKDPEYSHCKRRGCKAKARWIRG